jgi:hypothetical protein
LRPAFGLAQRGQQQRGQNADDCDDDQQFNQSECGGENPSWKRACVG